MGGIAESPTMNRRLLYFAAATATIGIAIAAAIYGNSESGRQGQNLSLVAGHIPRVESAIAGDVRFARVSVGRDTDQGGALWITGSVPTRHDALALREAIEGTEPPVAVRYSVRIDEETIGAKTGNSAK